MTYARARLLLGISGVGTAVLMASALLIHDIPGMVLSDSSAAPLGEAILSLVPVLLICAAIFFPFDVLGGAIVVRERPAVAAFLARWVRGVAVQLSVWLVSAAAVMTSARSGGPLAGIAALIALQFVLAFLRASFVRAIASFTTVAVSDRLRVVAQLAGIAPNRIVVLKGTDEGFVGGWSGIVPGRLMLPAHWLELPDDALVAVLRRRRIIAESGAHRNGVIAAILWNTAGLALVVALTGAQLATASGVLTIAAGMTLWAFLGVLVLPTPSRAAVHAIDAAAARESGAATLQEAIERLDRWQDDEPERSARVETIFHPVPSRRSREAALGAASEVTSFPMHHLARHALWLGWATLSPISRAVHCNVGRTALWAMLPGD